MDRIEIYQEIRSLQITYSIHFVFYLILGLEHIIIILKIFWYNKIHLKLFISISIIDVIFLFYPIIPLILMYRIILKKNLTKKFKLISLILIILSLLFGILISIFFWLNLKSTTNFSKECPYNLNDIKLFLNDDFDSDQCTKRRCILESINNNAEGYPFNYICNYNSQNEFEIDPNTQYPIKAEDGSIYYLKYSVRCEIKTSIDDLLTDKTNKNNENEIYIYLQKCWDNSYNKNFYLCQRYELPQKFDIDEKYICPKDNYNVILYLSGVFLIILDIILSFIPWSLDYKSYSRIISFDENESENGEVNNENNNDERRRHNETNTSSNNPNLNSRERNNENENNQNENNNNQNSERNNDNEFIQQPTETIIIARDRITVVNSSNIRSDRLNSGLKSNNISKSNINNSKNNFNNENERNKENNEKSNSLISKNESENMISNSSENHNIYENNNNNFKLNTIKINKNEDDIKFNNNIKYDEINSNKNIEEDEKDEEDKKSQNNYLTKNNNIEINNKIINLKKQDSIKNERNIILLNNKDKENNLIKSTNSIKTTVEKKGNIESNKKFEVTDVVDDDDKFEEIGEIINEDYHDKTPNKKTSNNHFSQVLTNIRETDQIILYKHGNKSMIKEERNEETEEEKNKSNKVNKRQNLNLVTQLNLKNKSKDKGRKKKFKNESISSLVGPNSNRSEAHLKSKEYNNAQNDLINNTEN